ncbi:MAG TPA: hypothetical protein VK907_09110 [Phnomibacter sp.]|nr:hypothetical protein [Phnomibacter sp.]
MYNFTPEDLLEYHYGEMPSHRAIELEKALKENWDLREKLAVIEEAACRLDRSMYSPIENSLKRILEYAALSTEQAISAK